jgi:Phage integrase family.
VPRRLGEKQPGTWDYGVDYEKAYRELAKLVQGESKGFTKCYAAIALVSLRNGSRIGEAIEAFKEFLRTSKTRIYVKVEKHKKEDYRLMIIPKELVEEDFSVCYPLLEKDKDVIRANVNKYLHRKLGINCHSLRYAFITYMLEKGVSPAIIAAITRHKNLNMILRYTERKEAERVLEEL